MPETPLRIAIIAPCWFEVPPDAYGGVEWLLAWLAEGLVDRGHEVTLIAAGENKTKANFLQTYRVPPSDKLGEVWPEVVQAAAAANFLKDLEVDVVHDNCAAGPLLAAGRKVPTVVTAHGPIIGDIAQYFRYLSPFIHLVAISEAQKGFGPDLPWTGRVYNAIPVNEYPYLAEKEDYAVFLGRLSPEKGADLAVDVVREAGFPLVMAGKCIEPLEKEYFRNHVAPKLADDVHWIGQADAPRKKDLLARARCLIFPIRWREPFGIVMAEALACGTPVVALNQGSVPEVVEDGVSGFVVDEPSDLAKAILRADEIDPAACRRRAEEMFDIPAMVSGYEAVYEKVTA